MILEQDLSDTSRYIEPENQYNVYSYEFAKIIVLANTEIESVFKILCKEISGENAGNMAEYKKIILTRFPIIISTQVFVPRAKLNLKPYEEWETGHLSWWDTYQHIKHSRGNHFHEATYKNALLSLSGLYILIFYLAKYTETIFTDYKSEYILSQYRRSQLLMGAEKHLPDYGDDMYEKGTIHMFTDNDEIKNIPL